MKTPASPLRPPPSPDAPQACKGCVWKAAGSLGPARHSGGEARYQALLVHHQRLDSTRSARRLSLFRVSYPTTMRTDVGREEMMRADKPLVIAQTPSSASSCLNVSLTDERPSTWDGDNIQESLFSRKIHLT